MKQKLQTLKKTTIETLKTKTNLAELDDFRIQILGKNGELTAILKSLKDLPNEEKPVIGKLANEIKTEIDTEIQEKEKALKQAKLNESLNTEKEDITLPGTAQKLGTHHPIHQMQDEVIEILSRLGFSVATGPEIETDFYNFEALNIPEDHPARDMHDTFYLNTEKLLRTHTSPVQIHTMQSQKPPLKILAPGKVYRCDADVSHSPVFHQIEGLYIDENVTFADLKGVIEYFLKELFGKTKKVRFRPSYFPFTTPSCEVDVEWDGKTPWLEIMGAGMVHPNVLKSVNYDSEKVTGFAFGVGIERLAMLKYAIPDIRLFYENHHDFLTQF